jgi:hypothetical protein
MFKRALQANHWMAIGLDKWNELENTEIPLEQIRKWRKLERGKDIEGETQDIEQETSSCEEKVFSDVQSDISDCESSVESEESETKQDGSRSGVSVQHCEYCPGKLFLSNSQLEAHLQSEKHLKRVKAAENPGIPTVTPDNNPITVTSEKKERREKIRPVSTNNRKARRAHLPDSRNKE